MHFNKVVIEPQEKNELLDWLENHREVWTEKDEQIYRQIKELIIKHGKRD